MPGERTTRDVKTRFKVDYSDLTKAEKAVARAHGQFASGAERSKLAATKLERNLGSLGAALSHLGPAGQAAGNALNTVGTTAGDVSGGLGLVGLAGGAAVISLAAVAGAAFYAEKKYEDLVERIDNYQDVTTSSAEEASRAVYMFQVLGISAATAEKAMYKLSKSIAVSGDQLEALGVHIKRNADGGVNLSETLYAVADAYDAASDSSTRSKILFQAFGKGGTEMIDVVKRGSVALRQMANSARVVLTDDDINRMREYKIRVEEAQTGWDDFVASLGQKVFPVLEATETSIRRGAFEQEGLNKAVKEGKISYDDIRGANMGYKNAASDLIGTLDKQFDAQEKDKHVTAELTATLKQQADEQARLAKNIDDAVNALQSQASAQIAADRANIALTTSQDKINAALKAYQGAVKEFGKNSAEARAALADYKNATLDQEEAYLHAADAAGKLARSQFDTAEAADAANASVDATIAKFQAEARTLGKNSPLRKQLLEYIADLQKIPRGITTDVRLRVTADKAGRALGGSIGLFQSGGEPPVGKDIIVGEGGPEIVRLKTPATVYPHGVEPPRTGGGDFSVVVNAQTNADSKDIARDVGWEWRRYRRTA